MQRHVIVASPKQKYVRVRRSCTASENKACQTTRVYYCPDMCHEINTLNADQGAGGLAKNDDEETGGSSAEEDQEDIPDEPAQ